MGCVVTYVTDINVIVRFLDAANHAGLRILRVVINDYIDGSIFGEVRMAVLPIFEWNIELECMISRICPNGHSTQLGLRITYAAMRSCSGAIGSTMPLYISLQVFPSILLAILRLALRAVAAVNA